MQSVLDCLISDALGPGELSDALSRETGRVLGYHGCGAFRNRSSALALLDRLLGLEPGDSILASPFLPGDYILHFQARSYRVHWLDVDPDLARMDLGDVPADSLTPRGVATGQDAELSTEQFSGPTWKALFLIHPEGIKMDFSDLLHSGIPSVMELTGLWNNFEVLETDNSTRERADFALVDMEEGATITAGGGCVLLARTKGLVKDYKHWEKDIGTSSLLPNLNSSLALTQLHSLELIQQKKSALFDFFQSKIMMSHYHLIRGLLDEEHGGVPDQLILRIPQGLGEVMEYCRKKGIVSRRTFSGISLDHLTEEEQRPLKNSRSFANQALSFPLYAGMHSKDAELLAKVISSLP